MTRREMAVLRLEKLRGDKTLKEYEILSNALGMDKRDYLFLETDEVLEALIDLLSDE